MAKQDKDTLQKVFNIINLVGIIAVFIFLIWSFKAGLLTDRQAMLTFMAKLGVFAPIVFVLIQFVQTVIPIIPGAVTIPLGVIMFGDIPAFFLNLTPIFLASIVNFYLAKQYGWTLVRKLIGEQNYQKAIEWVQNQNKFQTFLIWGLILPFLPADVICYVAGLTSLSYRRFIAVLCIGKPLSILIYSYSIVLVFDLLMGLFP